VVFKKANLNEDWEIENNFADLITSSLTLEHIKNLNPIFNKVNLKLKKDGLFFILEINSTANNVHGKLLVLCVLDKS
jgi:predicted TPR repeat methyltransferase